VKYKDDKVKVHHIHRQSMYHGVYPNLNLKIINIKKKKIFFKTYQPVVFDWILDDINPSDGNHWLEEANKIFLVLLVVRQLLFDL